MKKMDLTGNGPSQLESTSKQSLSGCDIMGIDLGTTNSAVSIFNAQTVPVLLPIGKNGKTTVPSCVRWDGLGADGQHHFTVGDDAYQERYKPNVIYSIKRIMGSDKTVTLSEHGTPQEVEEGNGLVLRPYEVSAIILWHLANKVAEFYRPLTKCIITVPAYFNQRQMSDTIKAAELAGLNCLQILKEPTSASFIYSQLGYAQTGAVLIYDLGGGTFDATHMTFLRRDSVPKKMATSLKKQYGIELSNNGGDVTDQYYSRVIGTYGDMQLGGDDIDKLFGDKAIRRSGVNLSDAGREQVYLRCEAFKKRGVAGEDIVVEGQLIHLDTTLLNECVDKIFDRTMKIIEDIDMSNVSTIVLVGGSTKSLRLRQDLQSAFPGMEISAVLDPDATVALGAGAVAKALANKKDLDYSDVLPLPIGVLVDEKSIDVCLQKNTSMPYSVTRTYYTIHDNQERVTVHLYQGLSSKPEKCTYLGRISVDGIPQRPAGDVCVTLSFILTGQGRLKVVSRVDGVDREEELVVDNIFTVGEESKSENPRIESTTFETRDDFEFMIMDAMQDSYLRESVIEMLLKRRNLTEGSDEAGALEAQIFDMMMSA